MRKLIVVAMLLSMSGVVHAKQILWKLDLSMPGTIDYTGTLDRRGASFYGETSSGFGVSVELHNKLKENFDWGIGLEYQGTRKITKIEGESIYDAQFSLVPVYGSLICNVPQSSLFLKGNLGYNIAVNNNSNATISERSTIKGGMYYGLGGGIKLSENMILELLYGIYHVKESAPEKIVWYSRYSGIRYAAYDFDITYKKLSMSISYMFDIK